MTQTKREGILTLLAWYVDLLNSWPDEFSAGDYGYPRPHPALRHGSYRRLERLLSRMRSEDPEAYWAIAERYWRAPECVVLRCARCGPRPGSPEYGFRHERDETMPAYKNHKGRKNLPRIHGHAQPNKLVPISVRTPSRAIRPQDLKRAIDTLERAWPGEVVIMPSFARDAA